MSDSNLNDIIFLTDADNTLWDTDDIYRNAQLRLLDAIQEYIQGPTIGDKIGFIRSYDQAIASIHHSELKYPPGLLVRALSLGLRGVTSNEAAAQVVKTSSSKNELGDDQVGVILNQYFAELNKPAKLRLGVKSGLETLQKNNIRTIIVTEGDKRKIENFLDFHHLTGIEQVISAKKNIALYRRLRKLGSLKATVVMVGDQLDKDIQFAQAAGVKAIYFEGGFKPEWTSNHDESQADLSVTSFQDAVNYVL